MYCAGVASTAAGDWVTIDEAHATVRAVADAVGRVGVAMSANVASQYGWYQIAGKCVALLAASCAADKGLSLSGTTAAADDGDQAGDVIHGAVSRAAVTSSATANCEISYPFVNDVADD
jgi:hypothetical protein